MKNFRHQKRLTRRKSDPVADQFSDDEMEQIKRYGQGLSGGVTPFDEGVERHLARYEAKRKRMEAARGAAYQVHKGSDCKKLHWRDTKLTQSRDAVNHD
jgi:hypothetical protein